MILNKVTYITVRKDDVLFHLNNETNDLLKHVGVMLTLNKIYDRYVPVSICPSSVIMRALYEDNIDALHKKFKSMSDKEVRNLVHSHSSIKKFNI